MQTFKHSENADIKLYANIQAFRKCRYQDVCRFRDSEHLGNMRHKHETRTSSSKVTGVQGSITCVRPGIIRVRDQNSWLVFLCLRLLVCCCVQEFLDTVIPSFSLHGHVAVWHKCCHVIPPVVNPCYC
jgi:hypothetical protein